MASNDTESLPMLGEREGYGWFQNTEKLLSESPHGRTHCSTAQTYIPKSREPKIVSDPNLTYLMCIIAISSSYTCMAMLSAKILRYAYRLGWWCLWICEQPLSPLGLHVHEVSARFFQDCNFGYDALVVEVDGLGRMRLPMCPLIRFVVYFRPD